MYHGQQDANACPDCGRPEYLVKGQTRFLKAQDLITIYRVPNIFGTNGPNGPKSAYWSTYISDPWLTPSKKCVLRVTAGQQSPKRINRPQKQNCRRQSPACVCPNPYSRSSSPRTRPRNRDKPQCHLGSLTGSVRSKTASLGGCRKLRTSAVYHCTLCVHCAC